MAALIDEYKQAIQDVLDGRAKPAPKPSELPWAEDMAATMWAAAAAELIAEANSGGSSGGGVLVVELDNDGNLDITAGDLFSAAQSGYVVVKGAFEQLGNLVLPVVAATNNDGGYYFAVGFTDGNTFITWLYHAALSTQKPSYYEP